jgi:hypothetical protein
MKALLFISLVFMSLSLGVCTHSMAQTASPDPVAVASAPNARELLQSKCSQCHNDAMWRDQRQDAKAWEATLYRMMGRGAVWSADDIVSMASFLGNEFGPQVPKIKR